MANEKVEYDLEAASRSLWNSGRFHGWWRRGANQAPDQRDFDEAYAADPIGKEEFMVIVEDILLAGLGESRRERYGHAK